MGAEHDDDGDLLDGWGLQPDAILAELPAMDADAILADLKRDADDAMALLMAVDRDAILADLKRSTDDALAELTAVLDDGDRHPAKRPRRSR